MSTKSLRVQQVGIETMMKDANILIEDKKYSKALDKLESVIRNFDQYHGITATNKSRRATIEENDAKLSMIDAQIKSFEVRHMKNQLNLNDLDLNVLENSVDLPVRMLDKELDTYKFSNKKNLFFKEYIALEVCRRNLVQLGAKAGLRRMTYHKLRVLTKLRFVEIIHQPGINLSERLKALILTIILIVFWATSDFGQNVIKYFASIVTLLVLFGLIYCVTGNFSADVPQTMLDSKLLFSMYVSVTSFFTLGSYNILPTDSTSLVVMSIQYVFGYFYLGLFIAILIDRVLN